MISHITNTLKHHNHISLFVCAIIICFFQMTPHASGRIYPQLSENEKKAYSAFEKSSHNYYTTGKSITYSTGVSEISEYEAQRAFNAYIMDHPEEFYLYVSCYGITRVKGVIKRSEYILLERSVERHIILKRRKTA